MTWGIDKLRVLCYARLAHKTLRGLYKISEGLYKISEGFYKTSEGLYKTSENFYKTYFSSDYYSFPQVFPQLYSLCIENNTKNTSNKPPYIFLGFFITP
jgi:hypothetical protein